MSITTKRHLNFIKDVLVGVFNEFKGMPKDGVSVATSDFVWKKAKYRKRARQPRQPRVVRERVIVRPSAPRVYVVKPKQEQ